MAQLIWLGSLLQVIPSRGAIREAELIFHDDLEVGKSFNILENIGWLYRDDGI